MHASFFIRTIGVVVLPLIIGCGGPSGKDTSGQKIRIVATTNIIADCIQELTGPYAEVRSIMGPGVDPHAYKASQGDVAMLQKADIIVYNGLHLEGKMSEILTSLSGTKNTIRLSDGLAENDIRSINIQAGIHDPHYWFDLMKWKKGLAHFIQEMSRIYPEHAEDLDQRSAEYFRQMDDLHEYVKDAISAIPPTQRILITSHDAFEYYGAAYGIQVDGLQGISTLSEAGLKDVTNMVNFIAEKRVKAVFVESSVSSKALMSVIEGCHRKGHEVKIGGELFSDALDAPDKPGGTYLGMIRENTTIIVNALK